MGLRLGVATVLAALAAGCSGAGEETTPTTSTGPSPGTTVSASAGAATVELADWGRDGGTSGTITLRDTAQGIDVVLALDDDVDLATLGSLRLWGRDCQSEYNAYTVGDVSVPILTLEPKGRRWRTTIADTDTDELGAVSVGFARMLFLCGDL